MGSLSVWHWLIFLAVALLLFGGSGKISSIMGDVAKGIKSFKKGMSEDDDVAKKPEPPKVIEASGPPGSSSGRSSAATPGEQQQTGAPSSSKFG